MKGNTIGVPSNPGQGRLAEAYFNIFINKNFRGLGVDLYGHPVYAIKLER